MSTANLEAVVYSGARREWAESMEWHFGGMTKRRFDMVEADLVDAVTLYGCRLAVAEIKRDGVLSFTMICRRGFYPGNLRAVELYIVRSDNPVRIRVYDRREI